MGAEELKPKKVRNRLGKAIAAAISLAAASPEVAHAESLKPQNAAYGETNYSGDATAPRTRADSTLRMIRQNSVDQVESYAHGHWWNLSDELFIARATPDYINNMSTEETVRIFIQPDVLATLSSQEKDEIARFWKKVLLAEHKRLMASMKVSDR